MSRYRASVTVEDGTLHTSRPLTAPEPVVSLFDSVVYDVTNGAGDVVQHVEVVVDTSGESETPVGDSIAATSSQPLPANTPVPQRVDDDEDLA